MNENNFNMIFGAYINTVKSFIAIVERMTTFQEQTILYCNNNVELNETSMMLNEISNSIAEKIKLMLSSIVEKKLGPSKVILRSLLDEIVTAIIINSNINVYLPKYTHYGYVKEGILLKNQFASKTLSETEYNNASDKLRKQKQNVFFNFQKEGLVVDFDIDSSRWDWCECFHKRLENISQIKITVRKKISFIYNSLHKEVHGIKLESRRKVKTDGDRLFSSIEYHLLVVALSNVMMFYQCYLDSLLVNKSFVIPERADNFKNEVEKFSEYMSLLNNLTLISNDIIHKKFGKLFI